MSDDTLPGDLSASIEALLFASPEPLSAAEIAQVFPRAGAAEIEAAVEEVRRRYESEGRALRIVAAAGGFRMVTRPEHAPALARLFQARNRSRLSQAALETLAIVAYRQPITSPEIQAVRGVDSQAVLRGLQGRRLVRIVGRKPVVGRPLLYGTTREFLIHFGLNSLDDLPQVDELAEIVGSGLAAGAAAPIAVSTAAEPAEEALAAELAEDAAEAGVPAPRES
jgi:segregation and condensation protein B